MSCQYFVGKFKEIYKRKCFSLNNISVKSVILSTIACNFALINMQLKIVGVRNLEIY